MRPPTALASHLEAISGLCREEEPKDGSTFWVSWWDRNWTLERPRWLEFAEVSTGNEGTMLRMSSRKSHGVLVSLWLNANLRTCTEKFHKVINKQLLWKTKLPQNCKLKIARSNIKLGFTQISMGQNKETSFNMWNIQ